MKKLLLIDLVRTFSILAVLALHLEEISFLRKPQNPWSLWIWEHFWRNGTYGVDCFFVVSGFLITGVIAGNTGGLWKTSFREFYIQRAGRILPLFCLSVLIGILMLVIPQGSIGNDFDVFRSVGSPSSAGFWICVLTFTFNWFLAFNPIVQCGLHFIVFWSLAVEEQFYLLFPYGLKKLKKSKNLCLLLVLTITMGLFWRLGCYLFRSSIYLQVCASPGAFDNIAIGILLYLAVDRWKGYLFKNEKLSWFLCVMGLGAMAGIYLGTSQDSSSERVYASTMLGLGLFTFLLGGLHLSFFELKFWKPLGLPGKYCYGIYLLHSVVLSIIHSFVMRQDAWTAFGFFVAVSAAVAGISYHFFEMPANRLIRRVGLG